MTANNYQLPIGESMSTAWHKVSGAKQSFWGALAILFLIVLGVGIFEELTKLLFPGLNQLVKLLIQILNSLLQAGLMYIGIKRAFDMPITYSMMFYPLRFDIALKVIGTFILVIISIVPVIIISILAGFVTALIPGQIAKLLTAVLSLAAWAGTVYLYIRLSVAIAFALDKELNPWEAIKMSFQATRGNFWNLFLLSICSLLILFISAIPIGIGLIWSLPFAYILYGVVYKSLLMGNMPMAPSS